jgi:spermidine synthase
MKPTRLLATAATPDGRPLTLHEHDGDFLIRVAGVELMSTRQHRSEERLAEAACGPLTGAPAARVLVGGLGMGFTLRAVLGIVRRDARVVVSELLPAVVAWNRDPAYRLAGDALADPRVDLIVGDVATVMKRQRFHAILLDVDNGPSSLSTAANDRLYSAAGIAKARAALEPGGCLAVWSAADDPGFVDRLRSAGFDVAVERVPTHATGGSRATLFIGRLSATGRAGRAGRTARRS